MVQKISRIFNVASDNKGYREKYSPLKTPDVQPDGQQKKPALPPLPADPENRKGRSINTYA